MILDDNKSALFYCIGNCSYSRGASTRIAKAILGVHKRHPVFFINR